ncbi:MAG: ComF family protein [Rhodobacteraceae bacterium]|nr:ComF family protein [Paracoccaceae bacterium]
MLRALKTSLIDVIFPPRCLACPEPTEAPHGLCPACWRDTFFIAGGACGKCGAPLMGAAGIDDVCEGCLRHPPAWDRGAAATVYDGAARRVVLALKHGDRLDMVGPLAGWLAGAGRELIAGCDVIAPTPLHWRRLVKRRYNQSAELAKRLGRLTGKPVVVDLLTRTRATIPQEGMNRVARAANQAGAFAVTPRRQGGVAGRAVLLIDDVLTSGATLSACADCLRAAGAARVDVLALARVAFADSLGL